MNAEQAELAEAAAQLEPEDLRFPEARSTGRSWSDASPHLLSGLCLCGECGGAGRRNHHAE